MEGYNLSSNEPLELDLGVVVPVLPLVLLPLCVLLQHLLLEVRLEPAVPQGHHRLSVKVGHHLEDSVVVRSVCVVKAVLKLLDKCPMRIPSVKVKTVIVVNILSVKSPLSDKFHLCPLGISLDDLFWILMFP